MGFLNLLTTLISIFSEIQGGFCWKMELNPGVSTEEPPSWDELYNVNLVPSELFLKFRKEIEGFRLGVNLEVILIL